MPIYVDNARLPWRGKLWCHLVADSLDELHSFAKGLGLKLEWFQIKASYPHYDVTISVRGRALAMGALQGDRRTIIDCAKKLKCELATISTMSPVIPTGAAAQRDLFSVEPTALV